jgi:hypothetical protein
MPAYDKPNWHYRSFTLAASCFHNIVCNECWELILGLMVICHSKLLKSDNLLELCKVHTHRRTARLSNKLTFVWRKINVKVVKYQLRGQRGSINIFTADQCFRCTSHLSIAIGITNKIMLWTEAKFKTTFGWMLLSENAGSCPYPNQVERCHYGLQTRNGETKENYFVKNCAYRIS